MNTGKFNIDYFELMFLAEACIPPRPIARTMFWQSLIDVHYKKMLPSERRKAFEWLKDKLDLENEDCRVFYARFNPDNQYRIRCLYNGKAQEMECFLMDDKYHTEQNRYVSEDYITNVEKIEPLTEA